MAKRRSSRKKSTQKTVKRRSARASRSSRFNDASYSRSYSNSYHPSRSYRRSPTYVDEFVSETIMPVQGSVYNTGPAPLACENEWQYFDFAAKQCLDRPNWHGYDMFDEDTGALLTDKDWRKKCENDNYEWNAASRKCVPKPGWEVYDPPYGWRKMCEPGKVYDWKDGNCVLPGMVKKRPLPRPSDVPKPGEVLQLKLMKAKLDKLTGGKTSSPYSGDDDEDYAFGFRKRGGRKSKKRSKSKRRSRKSKRRTHFMF